MKMSQHALERWRQRFGHLIPEEEWGTARRLSKKGRRRIAQDCLSHQGLMRGSFKGFYYLRSAKNVVFVVAPPEFVVTVFAYPK